MIRNNYLIGFLIALIAALIFIPFIGNCPLFDWDEINFAECAREMLVTDNYAQVQLNYRPFWEKPPFFIWLQAISMNMFGVNEFAARFPNAVCSIVSFLTLFHIGRKLHSAKFGLTWCLIYAGTILPHLFFKSGIIDPWFNLFIFLSIYNIILFLNNPEGKREKLNAILAGVFLGLAVLTKGPAALLIVGLTVVTLIIVGKNYKALSSKTFWIFSASALFFSLSWFIFELLRGNGEVIMEFITYQKRLFETGDAGHEGPFFYHALVLLAGCFPASILFIISYRKKNDLTPFQLLFRKTMLVLFWVVLILFSIVKTKIVHYSSLCYFPLTFIATLGVMNYLHEIKLKKISASLFWIIAITVSIAFVLIGLIEYLKPMLINGNLIKDEFAKQNLGAEVKWSGFESLLGLLFLAASALVYIGINKKRQLFIYGGYTSFLLFIYLSINILVPKVEQYTQQAVIDFYKAIQPHHCYVETHNYKSYAYLFYSQTKPEDYTNPDQLESIGRYLDDAEKDGNSRYTVFATANCVWMKLGKIDRPAYIVCKTKDEQDMFDTHGFTKLYDRNGYSFFVRMPAK